MPPKKSVAPKDSSSNAPTLSEKARGKRREDDLHDFEPPAEDDCLELDAPVELRENPHTDTRQPTFPDSFTLHKEDDANRPPETEPEPIQRETRRTAVRVETQVQAERVAPTRSKLPAPPLLRSSRRDKQSRRGNTLPSTENAPARRTSWDAPATRSPSEGSAHSQSHNRSSRASSSVLAEPHRQKSYKLSDPKPLSDGTDPTFASWKILIEDKLEENAEYFPSERLRMAYVFGRTEGEAQRHLEPLYRQGRTTDLQSAQAMIEHLQGVYEVADPVSEALHAFHRLYMHDSDLIQDFRTEFTRLASIAALSPTMQAESILYKLPRVYIENLQHYARSISLRVSEIPISSIWTKLIAIQTDRQQTNDILEDRRRMGHSPRRSVVQKVERKPDVVDTRRAVTRFPVSRPRGQTPSAPRISPDSRPSPTPRASRTPAPPRGQCYNCGEVGHYATDCPHPKKGGSDIRQIEDVEEVEELDSSEEKESPEEGNEEA